MTIKLAFRDLPEFNKVQANCPHRSQTNRDNAIYLGSFEPSSYLLDNLLLNYPFASLLPLSQVTSARHYRSPCRRFTKTAHQFLWPLISLTFAKTLS